MLYIHIISVCVSVSISQLLPPPPISSLYPYISSLCLYPYLCSNKIISTSFLESIHALICDICFPFCNLLHSIWHFLNPHTSLQMTWFHSSLRLSNTVYMYQYCILSLLYTCTKLSLSILLSVDTSIVSRSWYCKYCHHQYWWHNHQYWGYASFGIMILFR